MGASNRPGLLDAKLELLLGCALPPRHAEGASSSLQQALSAAPRVKILAYALHFAQQYGTAGEAGTGVALLEEYTRAYTQQYGLKAVDRRLVTLRPQLLEAHLESLSREARPPPRPRLHFRLHFRLHPHSPPPPLPPPPPPARPPSIQPSKPAPAGERLRARRARRRRGGGRTAGRKAGGGASRGGGPRRRPARAEPAGGQVCRRRARHGGGGWRPGWHRCRRRFWWRRG